MFSFTTDLLAFKYAFSVTIVSGRAEGHLSEQNLAPFQLKKLKLTNTIGTYKNRSAKARRDIWSGLLPLRRP